MNDYLLPRYTKNDVREYWSLLMNRKKDLNDQLLNLPHDQDKASYLGAIDSITFCMEELEKRFDLF